MSHPVVHFEIGGKDGARQAAFYRDLFGWTVAADPDYGLVEPEESGIGGGLLRTVGDMPNYVTVYVAVDDLKETLDRAVELGGAVSVKPTDIPGVGSFAMFTDPEGNLIGVLRQG